MKRVPAEKPVVFHQFDLFGLRFLVTRSDVTGGWFALFSGFGAFENDHLAWHVTTPYLWLVFLPLRFLPLPRWC